MNYTINYDLTRTRISGNTTIQITPSAYCELPQSITVTNGILSSWDPTTGVAVLSSVSDSTVIECVCPSSIQLSVIPQRSDWFHPSLWDGTRYVTADIIRQYGLKIVYGTHQFYQQSQPVEFYVVSSVSEDSNTYLAGACKVVLNEYEYYRIYVVSQTLSVPFTSIAPVEYYPSSYSPYDGWQRLTNSDVTPAIQPPGYSFYYTTRDIAGKPVNPDPGIVYDQYQVSLSSGIILFNSESELFDAVEAFFQAQ